MQRKATLTHPYGVGSIAFSPDGARLAANCHDGTAKLWDVDAGKLHSTLRTGYYLAGLVAYTRDGNKLLTFGTKFSTTDMGGILVPNEDENEGKVLLWDLRDTSSPAELIGKTTQVQQIAFCAAKGLMATVGDEKDNSIELWRLGKLVESWPPEE
jgi:WD40 repeat protein